MIKKSKKILLVMLATFIISPICVKAKDAETLGDLRRIYENLLAEKRANDNKTQQAKDEIARKEREINQAEKDLAKAEAEERETTEKIEESNAKIASLKSESEKVLLYMQQMQGNNVYVEYVTGATSMTEMIMRVEAVKQVTQYIQDTVNDLDLEIEKNEKLKEELKVKQEQLKKQVESYEATIAKLTGDINTYDKFALGVNEKLAIAKQDYEAYKNTCKQNLGREDDAVLLSDCSKVPVNGGWLKPLTRGGVTSTIGFRWGSYHNALDLGGNAEGTPVYAAASGRVSGITERYRCGGNMLFIQVTVGGKKYTTFYYHLLRINVRVGDIVDQNTVIGLVGGGSTSTVYGGYDSCTTGPHLHFGVAEGWYSWHTDRVIIPPGYPNQVGYNWNTRTAFYG